MVITSLDRLSRNKTDIKQELQWFKEQNIRLKILDLPTSLIEVPEGQKWILDMIQNILIEVMASIAEQERLTIKKRREKESKQQGKKENILEDRDSRYQRKWKKYTSYGKMGRLLQRKRWSYCT